MIFIFWLGNIKPLIANRYVIKTVGASSVQEFNSFFQKSLDTRMEKYETREQAAQKLIKTSNSLTNLSAEDKAAFAKVYEEGGGKDKIVLAKNEPIVLDKTRTWLVEHFPIKKKFNLKKIYKKHLREAEKEIILVTPYFMPKRWLSGALHQAVLRGVRVDILVPKNTDFFLTDRVNYFYMFKLSKLGINFYLESHMNHAKTTIIDGKEGIVGSNNLDFLSFELNSEVGIFFKDASAVRRLSDIVKEWKRGAVLFDFRHHKPKVLDYILSPFISIFTKIF